MEKANVNDSTHVPVIPANGRHFLKRDIPFFWGVGHSKLQRERTIAQNETEDVDLRTAKNS